MVKIKDLLGLVPKYIFESKKEIGEDKLVRYIAAVMEAARMEGVSLEEQHLVEYLVESLHLSGDGVEKAKKLIGRGTASFGELLAGIEEPELRVCILRDAYAMVRQDKNVDNVEMLSMERLGAALGLSERLVGKVTGLVDAMYDIRGEIEGMGD